MTLVEFPSKLDASNLLAGLLHLEAVQEPLAAVLMTHEPLTDDADLDDEEMCQGLLEDSLNWEDFHSTGFELFDVFLCGSVETKIFDVRTQTLQSPEIIVSPALLDTDLFYLFNIPLLASVILFLACIILFCFNIQLLDNFFKLFAPWCHIN